MSTAEFQWLSKQAPDLRLLLGGTYSSAAAAPSTCLDLAALLPSRRRAVTSQGLIRRITPLCGPEGNSALTSAGPHCPRPKLWHSILERNFLSSPSPPAYTEESLLIGFSSPVIDFKCSLNLPSRAATCSASRQEAEPVSAWRDWSLIFVGGLAVQSAVRSTQGSKKRSLTQR